MTDTKILTPADVKSAIKSGGGRLFIVEHEGERWATDSYWLTRVSGVMAETVAKYELEPGCYHVNGSFERMEQSPPTIGGLIPSDFDRVELSSGCSTDWVRCEFAKMPGMTGRVYVNPDAPAVLLEGHQGSLFGLATRYLEVATGIAPWDAIYVRRPRQSTGETVGVDVYRQLGATAGKPVVVAAWREMKVYHQGKPATSEKLVTRRTLLMPVKVS